MTHRMFPGLHLYYHVITVDDLDDGLSDGGPFRNQSRPKQTKKGENPFSVHLFLSHDPIFPKNILGDKQYLSYVVYVWSYSTLQPDTLRSVQQENSSD